MLFFAIVSCLLLICIQGGFYAQTYIIAGCLCASACVIKGKKLVVSHELFHMTALALIYIISAIVSGMAFSVITAAILPVVMLIMAIMLSYMDSKAKDILIVFLQYCGVISGVIALFLYVGMYMGLFNIPGLLDGNRLLFTFGYANVCGIWFAISFLLTFFSNTHNTKDKVYKKNPKGRKNIKWMQAASIVCLIDTLLTRSAGSVIILFTAFVIHMIVSGSCIRLGKAIRRTMICAFVTATIMAALLIIKRGSGVLSSFVERFVQSYDGIRYICTSPLKGAGPSNWQYIFNEHQSAQYSARIVHNNYVQAGLDAGIIAVILLIMMLVLAIYKYCRTKRVVELIAVCILVDAFIEYNLMFSSIYMLFVICFLYEPVKLKNTIQIKPLYMRIVSFVILISVGFSGFALAKVKTLEGYAQSGNIQKAEKIYEKYGSFMENGYRENEAIGILLCTNSEKAKNDDIRKDFSDNSRKSCRLKMYEVISDKDSSMDEIIRLMESQPFNTRVHRNTKEMVENNGFSDEEKLRYRQCLDNINKRFNMWPAVLLNNQNKY